MGCPGSRLTKSSSGNPHTQPPRTQPTIVTASAATLQEPAIVAGTREPTELGEAGWSVWGGRREEGGWVLELKLEKDEEQLCELGGFILGGAVHLAWDVEKQRIISLWVVAGLFVFGFSATTDRRVFSCIGVVCDGIYKNSIFDRRYLQK